MLYAFYGEPERKQMELLTAMVDTKFGSFSNKGLHEAPIFDVEKMCRACNFRLAIKSYIKHEDSVEPLIVIYTTNWMINTLAPGFIFDLRFLDADASDFGYHALLEGADKNDKQFKNQMFGQIRMDLGKLLSVGDYGIQTMLEMEDKNIRNLPYIEVFPSEYVTSSIAVYSYTQEHKDDPDFPKSASEFRDKLKELLTESAE